MSEYERLKMEEGDYEHDDRRFRQRTLQRERFSMLLSFLSGVMVTMIAYPRLQPCADLNAVARAAAARCPACPACAQPTSTGDILNAAIEKAVSKCPTCNCPKCPDFPSCPACPTCASGRLQRDGDSRLAM